MKNKEHTPDILNCLANLSNDEVFTPPELACKMLDMLPLELFTNPNTRFLDPVSKTGVFLREIEKRLMTGLEKQIPDKQKRIDHIFKNQIFSLAITELTAEMSRRTVYCSRKADSEYSVCQFADNQGNIRYKRINHTWEKGRCAYCGASQSVYERGDDRETYAYQFIHTKNPQKLFNNMQFDVIIGNPPYQLSFGIEGANSANSKSIYNLFLDQANKLMPKYIVMITPSRWMTKTAQGIPESWVDKTLQSNKFKIIHDFEDASECFPGVEIKGGVNYFLWDNSHDGKCYYYFHQSQSGNVICRYDYLDAKNARIVIRDPRSYAIIEKIENVEGPYYNDTNKNFSGLVSAKHFFDNSDLLTSNWTGYSNVKDSTHNIKYYVNENRERSYKWISINQLPKNKETKDLCKVFIPAAGGSGNDDIILGKPFYGEPNSVCSQTFLVIGYDSRKHHFTEEECINIITYIHTRFFRYLVSIKKKTQNGPRAVYQFVPLQDFSHPWTDAMLYGKYDLTAEEIAFIESMIRPME